MGLVKFMSKHEKIYRMFSISKKTAKFLDENLTTWFANIRFFVIVETIDSSPANLFPSIASCWFCACWDFFAAIYKMNTNKPTNTMAVKHEFIAFNKTEDETSQNPPLPENSHGSWKSFWKKSHVPNFPASFRMGTLGLCHRVMMSIRMIQFVAVDSY